LQSGSSLVELLVGVALGLMVVTAAIGTLVLSRTTARGVNDQLELQQQANMAIRIMGTQLRMANTREMDIQGTSVIFSAPPTYTASVFSVQALGRDAQDNDNLGVAYADVGPLNAPTVTERSQDCLGNSINPAPAAAGTALTSRFYVDTNNLMCQGTNAATGPQPLIGDVQRFRVRYVATAGTDQATLTNYYTLATLPANPNIVGIELCLELASPPRAGVAAPAGTYQDCDGAVINLDTRARAVVRQVVRLRSVPVV
jgi:type IV pilus assembly protein PilW